MGAEATGRLARGGNLIALALGQAFRLGSGLAINVLLMRMLGVDGFGVYGYVMTMVAVSAFAASMGMERLINRELSRAPEQRPALIGAGVAATTVLSLVTTVGVLLYALATDGRQEVVLGAGIATLASGVHALSLVLEAAFHAARDMRPSARAQMAGKVVLVVATLGGLLGGLGLISVFIAQLLDGLVALGWVGWAYHRRLGFTGHRTSFAAVRSLVRRAWPFGMSMLFASVYLSVDVLVLGLMRGDTEVGLYRGAFMLIVLFPVIANTLTTGYFPKLARTLGEPEKTTAELRFVARVLLAISVPAAVGGMVVAQPLMVFLGGEEYLRSALSFVILAPMLPLRYLNNAYATTLSTLNRQRDRTRGTMIAAGVNLGLNLLIIPRFGAEGAAATTLATEVVLHLWFRWRVGGLVTDLGLGRTLLQVGVPAAVMAAVLLPLDGVQVVLQILVGVAVYAGVGRVSGAWSPADLRRLRRV